MLHQVDFSILILILLSVWLLTTLLLFLGQIMQTLERLNLKQNTLVYMTSDQGPHLEEISIHGEMHGGYSSIYKGILSKGLPIE